MKLSDIMRDIADLIDQKMGSQSSDNDPQHRLDPVEVDKPKDEVQPKMVPPLQAKLEILKKSEGLPNVYDDCGDSGPDELAAIKKNAGLTAAQHEAADDEPLDN
jgi:hypothetical protein